MSTTTDRGAVQLALECATKLHCEMLRAGVIVRGTDGTPVPPIGRLLEDATLLLAWHDERLSERAGRDELKRKAPITLDMGPL